MHNASRRSILFIALVLINIVSHLHCMNPEEIDPEKLRIQTRERHLVIKSLFKGERYHQEMAYHLSTIEQDQSPVVDIKRIEIAVILESLRIPENDLVALKDEYKRLQQQCYDLRQDIQQLQKRKEILEPLPDKQEPDPAVYLCGIQ